jgi:tRNA nucleotidyltransferase (CCA-adding enzyme)
VPELLLVDWPNAIICHGDRAHDLCPEVDEDRNRPPAREPIDRDRHQPAVEVKGATHTALRVEQQSETQWVAQCVIDV